MNPYRIILERGQVNWAWYVFDHSEPYEPVAMGTRSDIHEAADAACEAMDAELNRGTA